MTLPLLLLLSLLGRMIPGIRAECVDYVLILKFELLLWILGVLE